MRAEGGGEPFQDLSLAELVRLSSTAGRAFAQVAQVERIAHGMNTDSQGAPLVPPEIERKTIAELEEYLLGTAEAREEAKE